MAQQMKELEKKLWASADALRGNISSEEYMYIVIGIMFIKHMSDKYNKAIKLIKEKYGDKWEAFAANKDILSSYYNVPFLIPEKGNWNYIAKYATSSEIGAKLDEAFIAIEDENIDLKGLFEKRYNKEDIDQGKLGQVVSEFSNVDLEVMGEDIIGRTYEYFLGQFFKKQGQKGGEFYTPKSIVDLMVKIVDPTEGKIYDPTAGTGGMIVQARQHIIEQGKDPIGLVAYGQEYQNKTWKLSRINLLLHGFDAKNLHMGHKSADTLMEDLHKGKKFDYVLANPPFNVKKWVYNETENDERWEWGRPPKGNANLAFISHMIHKLKSTGRGASVLANGELSSSGKDAISIRRNMIADNKIEAILTLPDKLFYTTGIPACIWFFNNQKTSDKVLMVNGSEIEGNMISKKVRELQSSDIQKITDIFKRFRAGEDISELGFAKAISKKEFEENDYSFVPGRYVGFVEEVIDKEKAKKEIKELSGELNKLLEELSELTPKVKDSIKKALED